MFGFEKLFKRGNNYTLLVQNGAVIIDVRTPAEFTAGHIPGSKNISLDKLAAGLKELKKLNRPVITCCQSGTRSGIASRMLKSAGIDAYNGGAWNVLLKKIS